jgi:hypothetical protein
VHIDNSSVNHGMSLIALTDNISSTLHISNEDLNSLPKINLPSVCQWTTSELQAYEEQKLLNPEVFQNIDHFAKIVSNPELLNSKLTPCYPGGVMNCGDVITSRGISVFLFSI